MKRIFKLIFLFVSIAFLNYACQTTKTESKKESIKIILDTDMGSDCDDVGAMALLHTYADMGEVEIIGCIYSSGKIPFGAGIIEAINIYYGRSKIPIGADHLNFFGDSIDKMEAEKLVKDTSAFKNTIIHNTDTYEQTMLNRTLLVENPDSSITYVTIGHTKGLYDLLISKPDEISPLSGYELIKKKVSRWVALGAKWAYNKEGYYTKDWNFFFNEAGPYTKYLVDNFPCPIFFTAGSDAKTGKSLSNTPPGNIVRTAYRDWLWNFERKTLEEQRHSSDLMTIYYAVEGLGKFLEKGQNGYLDFDTEKGCRWIVSDTISNHSFIYQKEKTNKDFASYLNEMISRPPKNKRD
jgi:hypothetical protein